MDHLPYNIGIGDPVLVELERRFKPTIHYTGLVAVISHGRKFFQIVSTIGIQGDVVRKSFDIPMIQAAGDEIRVTPYTLN